LVGLAGSEADRLEIVDATQAFAMDEAAADALRKKKDFLDAGLPESRS